MKKEKAELAAAVAEAEGAVASVKDPELRRAAFEKVLEHLLGAQSGLESKPRTRPSRAQSTKGKAKGGPQHRVEELIDEGFFKKPRTLSDVKAELANRGYHIPRTSLGTPLARLCRSRRLRRSKGVAGDNSGFGYTNW